MVTATGAITTVWVLLAMTKHQQSNVNAQLNSNRLNMTLHKKIGFLTWTGPRGLSWTNCLFTILAIQLICRVQTWRFHQRNRQQWNRNIIGDMSSKQVSHIQLEQVHLSWDLVPLNQSPYLLKYHSQTGAFTKETKPYRRLKTVLQNQWPGWTADTLLTKVQSKSAIQSTGKMQLQHVEHTVVKDGKVSWVKPPMRFKQGSTRDPFSNFLFKILSY